MRFYILVKNNESLSGYLFQRKQIKLKGKNLKLSGKELFDDS